MKPIELVNLFYKTNLFNILPNFLVRKIRKFFKYYFIETDLDRLPNLNHPSNLNSLNQEKFIKQEQENNFIVYFQGENLIKLLTELNFNEKDQFNLLDFGGGDIKNYICLKKKYKNINYFYFDQQQHNSVMENLKQIHNLSNFTVLKNLDEFKKYNFDFINIGSSIQYVSNYKFLINLLTSLSSKYIFFSATVFFQKFSNVQIEHIIVKQINIHPQINYMYFFEMNYFINLLNKKSYKPKFFRANLADKKINFNNFSKKYKKIEYLDVLFAK